MLVLVTIVAFALVWRLAWFFMLSVCKIASRDSGDVVATVIPSACFRRFSLSRTCLLATILGSVLSNLYKGGAGPCC